MTGIYYPQLLDVLRAAGVTVAESETTAGWQTRARSSGGFPAPPLGVWWHHTASATSPANDLAWMIDGSDDAPIGNLLVDRTGTVWPIAAGASNCAGKGGPWAFSRGTCPADSGNTRGWQCEAANAGTGEPWPTVQVDAMFAVSNALNALCGNRPDDVVTHQAWAPDRKIDPATAAAVTGPWRPSSSTNSGSWSFADIGDECARRATPTPPTPEDDDMPLFLVESPEGGWYATDFVSGATAVPTVDVGYDGIDKGFWRGAGRAPIQLDVNGWQKLIASLPLNE